MEKEKGKSEEDEKEGGGPLIDSLPFIGQTGGPHPLFLVKPWPLDLVDESQILKRRVKIF